jgi:hypothetical protein
VRAWVGWIVAAITAVAAAPAARADSLADTFATFFQVAPGDVTKIAGYELPSRMHYTHLLIGQYTENGHAQNAIALMRCNRQQCTAERVWLDGDSDVDMLGVIDLAGGPGKVSELAVVTPSRGGYDAAIADKTRRKWPALVVRTRHQEATTSAGPHGSASGIHATDHLIVVSLAAADAALAKVFDAIEREVYPTGNGESVVFRLERGKGKGKGKPLDLVGTVQRSLDQWSGCLEPEPFERRYVATKRRYQQDSTPDPTPDCY